MDTKHSGIFIRRYFSNTFQARVRKPHILVCGTHYEDGFVDKENALEQAAKLQAKIHKLFSSALASIEWALVSTHTGEGISFLRSLIHKTVCRYAFRLDWFNLHQRTSS